MGEETAGPNLRKPRRVGWVGGHSAPAAGLSINAGCPRVSNDTMARDICTASTPSASLGISVAGSDALLAPQLQSPRHAISDEPCSGLPAAVICLPKVLERVRRRFHFVVVGCVAMPEHIHLLIGGMQQLSALCVWRLRAGGGQTPSTNSSSHLLHAPFLGVLILEARDRCRARASYQNAPCNFIEEISPHCFGVVDDWWKKVISAAQSFDTLLTMLTNQNLLR